MSVTYMLKLEQEPPTYDKYFTQLTNGINKLSFDWINAKIQPNGNVVS